MNSPQEPLNQQQDPLSEAQLDQFLKQARPVPPADWQLRFWNELEPKLAQEPKASAALIRPWFRQPWSAAAAAALLVLVMAVPLTQKLGQQAADRQAPMTLGASIPEDLAPGLANDGNLAEADFNNQAMQTMNDQLAKRAPAPALAQRKAKEEVSPADRSRLESLESLLKPFHSSARALSGGEFEIRIPVEQDQAFDAALKNWRVPHSRLKQALHEQGQVVYRVRILP